MRLTSGEIDYGLMDPGMSQMVKAVNPTGNKAPFYLVLTLGSGLNALNSRGNRVFDKLVITQLKMKAVVVAFGPPVPPKEIFTLMKRQTCGDDLTLVLRGDQ